MYPFLILVLVSLVSGYVSESPCKYAEPVQNFDLKEFGHNIWYQVARYDNDIERMYKCLTYNYVFNGDSTTFRTVNSTEDSPHFIEATGKFAANAAGSGLIDFTVTYTESDNGPKIKRVVPVTFLTVDYDNYAILYSCRNDESKDTKIESAWILSRYKKLTGDAHIKLQEYIKTSKVLDSSKFVWLDFSEEACNE